MDMMNYIIWKYFYRKPEEILSFLMILDENPNFPPKIVKNLHIQILIKNKIKIKVQIFYFLNIFYSTWLVLRLCQFSSQSVH